MRRFLHKTLIFTSVLLGIVILGLLTLTNKKVLDSGIGIFPIKQKLLESQSSPKIIFIGGSNLSFGLNSERISQKFNAPVINMGIHAGIGLRFMMKSTKPYIKKGDIVVLSTEYEDYYNENYFGNIEAVGIVFDIAPSTIEYLSVRQFYHLSPLLTKYACKNIINLPQTLYERHFKGNSINTIQTIYDISSFNGYGDVYMHWDLDNRPFLPAPQSIHFRGINTIALEGIKELKNYVENLGAYFLLLPPVYQKSSYINQEHIIKIVESELIDFGIPFDSPTNRYVFDDSLFFNTRYHPNKTGLEFRTSLVIEDISKAMLDKSNIKSKID